VGALIEREVVGGRGQTLIKGELIEGKAAGGAN
jgi:hypothetical protein